MPISGPSPGANVHSSSASPKPKRCVVDRTERDVDRRARRAARAAVRRGRPAPSRSRRADSRARRTRRRRYRGRPGAACRVRHRRSPRSGCRRPRTRACCALAGRHFEDRPAPAGGTIALDQTLRKRMGPLRGRGGHMADVPLILVVGGDALAVRVCEELCSTQGHRVALVWPHDHELAKQLERIKCEYLPFAPNDYEALRSVGVSGRDLAHGAGRGRPRQPAGGAESARHQPEDPRRPAAIQSYPGAQDRAEPAQLLGVVAGLARGRHDRRRGARPIGVLLAAVSRISTACCAGSRSGRPGCSGSPA